jgi:hypothetical protein
MKTKHLFLLVFALIFAFCLAPGPVMGVEGVDPNADKILKSMSSYLGEMEAFSMNADIDFEIVSRNGQKLQLSSFATAVLKRPAEFHIQRKGMIANLDFIFDGKTLTLHGKNLNVYAQIEVPGTIDDAIRAYELETGIPAPGADLLFTDPYTILSTGVDTSVYLGIAYVNGVECHHLAFREAKVDWQLWVKTGDAPLPMKYVITSKWHTAAPQYEIRFRDWDTNPQINDGQFTFSAPEGATRLETIPVNEMGEFITEEDK